MPEYSEPPDTTSAARSDAPSGNSRDRYRAIVQEAAVGIAQVAADGRYLEVNHAFCEMLGYTRDELLSMSDAAITHPDDVHADIAEVARLQRGETSSYALEKRLKRKNGRALWTLVVSSAVRDEAERLAYRVIVVHDIQQRKLTEAAYLRRNRQLALLSETAEELLMTEDPWGYFNQLLDQLAAHLDVEIYLLFRPAADRTLELCAHRGVSSEVAAHLSAIETVHPVFGVEGLDRQSVALADVRRSRDPRAALVRELEVSALVSHPLVGRSGPLGSLAFGSRTRTDFDAESLALIWAICDQLIVAIERKKAEDALRDADRRKDEFLAMLAHELRNPLAAILSATQLVEAIQQPSGELHEVSEIIKRQLSHLTHLIDDLLDVARITRGKIKLDKRQVDLRTVLEQAIETSRPAIVSRGHHLNLNIAEEPLCIEGDPTRLAQVIENLISNAGKYTDPGGEIMLSCACEGERVVVRIRDTGIGISAEMLPHVFDLFAQANVELDRTQGGLGVGLTLARALVALHDGTLEAHSEGVGHGSEFVLSLPQVAVLPVEQQVESPDRDGHKRSACHKVLVVDDNHDAVQMMSLLLRLDGHLVETANDGYEAVEVATQFQPDVVLLDLGLPGLNGFDVARRLREQDCTHAACLIALTGYGQDEDKRRSREAGFDFHLVKPVDKAELDRVLTQV